ncbi:MAG: prolyl oligopeptidase family serine peptidase [Bacteroidetes bacterium]|nr:prolyl oligopeptidase family serine peptidase [Bacteroidota bacterium]
MRFQQNIVLYPHRGRPFLVDVCYRPDSQPKPLVIWVHGFMGFKDWGPYSLMAESFAAAGFVFVKFNMSHNGTTLEHPSDFIDTEAFGQNNFEKELDDLGSVIDWIVSDQFPVAKCDVSKDEINLIGHSRGGGIVTLKAGEDPRVKKIATWAAVNEFGKFWKADQMEKIRQDGVIYVTNGRTGQRLPIYRQMYENYFAQPKRLYIPDVVRRLHVPMLIVHGDQDEAVPPSSAAEMKEWKPDAELMMVKDGNHVFGGKHPWESEVLPSDLKNVIDKTIEFFKKQIK